MNPWTDLVPVQELDTRLLRIDHALANLPERAERDRVDDELAALRRDVEAAEAEKHDLVRAQRKLDDEASLLRDKITEEEGKLYGEGSTDPGHLQDLQSEIAALTKRVESLEDQELDLMERIEPIDARLGELGRRREALDADAAAANAALAEAEATLDSEKNEITVERDRLVAAVDPDVVARYDQARQRMGGVAVAVLQGGTCGACHMKLSAVELDRVQRLVADSEVQCEECGRFLVRP